jgi:hypothetical protein
VSGQAPGAFKMIPQTAEGRLVAFGASSLFQPQPTNSTTSFARALIWTRESGRVPGEIPNVVDLSVCVPASVYLRPSKTLSSPQSLSDSFS